MSAEQAVSVPVLRAAMIGACDRVSAERDELCALDAVAGDGDLGVTLAAGFAQVRSALKQLNDDDAGQLLAEAGSQLARKAPSTIGTLLGTAFMRAGAAVQGVTEVEPKHVTLLLRAALEGVAERGGAQPGQRTIVDALDGAVRAAADAEAQGFSAQDVFLRAAEGAASAAEETASMEPQHGRAAWLPDRARGSQDAGAVAWAVYLGALADGVSRTVPAT